MYFYRIDNTLAASFLPDLPFDPAEPGAPSLFLTERDNGPASFRATRSHHLTDPAGVRWLADGAALERPLTAVNLRHPRWRDALAFTAPKPGKKRVHLLAVGDVGGTLLTALKLLGGDCISAIGIRDLNENTVARWTAEMGQIAWPWDYDALPEVEAVPEGRLFDCDVFIFAATKAIPAVGSIVQDVRMAQFAANRPLVEHFAKQAREARFGGLFMVLSDPVDPLCKAAWLASNTAPNGTLDHRGLLPEQVQGFGLGVMNARAAYFAKQDSRFVIFLTEGRAFGPHGRGLVIANSIEHYDDALSRELTEKVETANLRIRDLGFKPYVAPAVSSGAMQLLLTLRGDWHCSSIPLGDVWFGVKNRFTPQGLEVETLPLPEALLARLQETEALLKAIV
ncbi:lactate dehydrogenase [Oscillibacter sp.]|uniref:lactate dehydrogenase n=1 Tax=Oscillibacter sp. TaxID=1945593 RepID=UPI001B73EFAC|nr:lactate dehydrogenase [Oscillibacter sp.]MBP3509245.1 lactate dehydrogenase [Oscillibacter sp.]